MGSHFPPPRQLKRRKKMPKIGPGVYLCMVMRQIVSPRTSSTMYAYMWDKPLVFSWPKHWTIKSPWWCIVVQKKVFFQFTVFLWPNFSFHFNLMIWKKRLYINKINNNNNNSLNMWNIWLIIYKWHARKIQKFPDNLKVKKLSTFVKHAIKWGWGM